MCVRISENESMLVYVCEKKREGKYVGLCVCEKREREYVGLCMYENNRKRKYVCV